MFDVSAYAFAPQGLVAPLNGLDVVWNTLMAPFTLGESITWKHILGTGLVAGGACLTSIFGPKEEVTETLDVLEKRLTSLRTGIYAACFFLLMMLIFSILTLRNDTRKGDKVRGFLLAMTAGCIAGNMIFVSSVMSLLRNSIKTSDWSVWHKPLPLFLIVCAATVAVSNIPFMAKALYEYEAVFVVTLFEVFHIVVACISGAVVLQGMDNSPPWECKCYWSSVGIICFGLFIIQTTSVNGIGENDRTSVMEHPAGDFLQVCTSAHQRLVDGGATASQSTHDGSYAINPWTGHSTSSSSQRSTPSGSGSHCHLACTPTHGVCDQIPPVAG